MGIFKKVLSFAVAIMMTATLFSSNADIQIVKALDDAVVSSSEGSDVSNYEDMTISSDTTLDSDKIVNNLSITSGVLNLNGKKLTVNGSVNVNYGFLNINKGQLTVNKDLNIGNSYTHLKMVNTEDYVLVKGNFNDQSNYSHNDYLTAGTLEVQGNFTQGYSQESFYATGTHRFYLSADSHISV